MEFFNFFTLTKKSNSRSNNRNNYKKKYYLQYFKNSRDLFFKKRKNKILFSHNQFKPYFFDKKLTYFNFLFYKFKIKNNYEKKKI